jgi:hypothetical protein
VWSPAPSLHLSSPEQAILEAVAASADIPARVRKRAQIILRAAGGVPNSRIAQSLSVTRAYVLYWRGRFLAHGIRGLWNLERVPPREPIPEAVEQAVVFDCLYRSRVNMLPPWDGEPSPRWNVHNLAIRHGISQASVGRIWKKHGIQMAGVNGIKLSKIKISQDPLFSVTVSQIGLMFEPFGPAVAFYAGAHPFSELSFSSLPVADRNRLIERLIAELRKLERRRANICYANPLTKESLERFVEFVKVSVARYAKGQIHLLFKDPHHGAHDFPAVREWLASQSRVQLHYAPITAPNGQHWTDLAEHWLKVIVAWPTQSSLVESMQHMIQLLEKRPPDQLDHFTIG